LQLLAISEKYDKVFLNSVNYEKMLKLTEIQVQKYSVLTSMDKLQTKTTK